MRSSISSSIRRRKRIGLFKKIIYSVIFILFFASLFILSLTSDKLTINKVIVSGNTSVSTADILKIADERLNDRYLWFIRTDNLFLLRRNEIRSEILGSLKKIESIKIGFNNLNDAVIYVTERIPANIWCRGVPGNPGICFFTDKYGLIFSMAPKFSDNLYPEYFGLISAENAIGENYFDSEKFTRVSKLFSKVKEMNFSPLYFYAKDSHEYEIGLSGGGKILINDKKSFDSVVVNLQALIDNNYIKTTLEFLKKINYIDLRYGNKVPIDIK